MQGKGKEEGCLPVTTGTAGHDSLIGRTLSHYRIIQKIGSGGMGVVYKAEDTSLDRFVALKFLPEDLSHDHQAMERFQREAKAASALNHPNICTIYEVNEVDGQAFISMELVEGQSLSAHLFNGPLSADEVIRYALQLADGLAHAHEHGVIHRDLKSANVMITRDGRAKVLDFGLAKRFTGTELDEVTRSQASLTAPGALVGTLAYMAPEQLRGQPADARSDIWALGVVLYDMATGHLPFRGQTGYELSSAIMNQAPRPLPSQVPTELRAVIRRCLEKEPGWRFQRAGEVREVLEAIQEGAVAPWVAWRYRLARRPWLALVAALLVTVAVVVGLNVGGLRGRLFGGKTSIPVRSIRLAVLPFANLTGDPEQEYLSDGLTQEMITQLGRLHPETLSVIARTSVMRYKQTDKPIDQIGRELGVDYILEGSARREAGRIRINAELIQVRDQAQLWAESYERELASIMALQSDVASRVASSLTLTLLPAERMRLVNVRNVNPEAYEAYLHGLHHFYELTPGGFDTAQKYYELALEKDPNFALAYAGIALVWGARGLGITPPGEAAPKANAAALKAVALDDTLAEAHYALASIKTWLVWDLPGAEPEWRRAIELNPNLPDARAFYSHYLCIMGHQQEAEPQITRALELDPFNSLFQSLYGTVLVYQRRYDDAIAHAKTALRISPDSPDAHSTLWVALFLKGMYKDAFVEAKANFPGDHEMEEALERGYTESGYPGAMRRAAEVLVERSHKTYVSPESIAELYLQSGEKNLALQWFEKAFEIGDPNMLYLGLPFYDSLRSDPRFQDLLRRMNLA